jgi:hypothetical protein
MSQTWPDVTESIPPPPGGAGQPLATAHVEAHEKLANTAQSLQTAFGLGQPAERLISRLPPALVVGSGLQFSTFSDERGDMWVAKAGVNSGQWFRAEDVLLCSVYRSAAWTWQTTYQTIGWDAPTLDQYGMLGSTGAYFTAPVHGLYSLYFQASAYVNTGARIEVGVANAANNAAFSISTSQSSINAAYLTAETVAPTLLNAGDSLVCRAMSNVVAAGVTSPWTRAVFQYIGKGPP